MLGCCCAETVPAKPVNQSRTRFGGPSGYMIKRPRSSHELFAADSLQIPRYAVPINERYLLTVLKNYEPDLVVIEACGLCGWVHDVCTTAGYKVLVCPARRSVNGLPSPLRQFGPSKYFEHLFL